MNEATSTLNICTFFGRVFLIAFANEEVNGSKGTATGILLIF
jgi:hypothetical protein